MRISVYCRYLSLHALNPSSVSGAENTEMSVHIVAVYKQVWLHPFHAEYYAFRPHVHVARMTVCRKVPRKNVLNEKYVLVFDVEIVWVTSPTKVNQFSYQFVVFLTYNLVYKWEWTNTEHLNSSHITTSIYHRCPFHLYQPFHRISYHRILVLSNRKYHRAAARPQTLFSRMRTFK